MSARLHWFRMRPLAAVLLAVGAYVPGCRGGPTAPSLVEMPRFTQVTAGERHACALTDAGTVYCWGDGSQGQLGTGDFASRRIPALVATDLKFLTIDAGRTHTCGVTSDRAVYCWGSDAYGQLGDGGRADRSIPVRVDTDVTFDFVSAGGYHTCAVGTESQGHRVYCWGADAYGQVGNGRQMAVVDRPVAVSFSGRTQGFRGVSAGAAHTCGATRNETVFCWGRNDLGQAGVAGGNPVLVPVELSINTPVRAVAAGFSHTCAVTRHASVLCWGSNHYYELGRWPESPPGMSGGSRPGGVFLGQNYVAVSAGNEYTCGVQEDGSAKCWGRNDSGQLGRGTTDSDYVPMSVIPDPNLPGGKPHHRYRSVSAEAATYACGITTQAQVYCWGWGPYGQLGSGTTDYSTVPVAVTFRP